MRTLTTREKRTIRFAGIGIVIYLILFCGLKGWSYFGNKRLEYQQLVRDAARLKQEVEIYEGKSSVVKKLMDGFRMDPMKLSRASVVAEASAALQKAAAGGGVQVGPVRETPGRPSSKELGSVQMEGAGQLRSVIALLHQIQSVGFPLIVDSVQITQEATKPGMAKINLTIVILDFEQWSKEAPNA